MMTTTMTASEQQFLSLDSISHIDFELEGMLSEEFEQGLPTDLLLGI